MSLQQIGNLMTWRRVLLVDGDSYSKRDKSTGVANLALMKLCAFFESRGCVAGFDVTDPDGICASSVFSWNAPNLTGLKTFYDCPVLIGGTGTRDYSIVLPDEIEHIRPAYHLYGLTHSLGYSSRGCPNGCGFCEVPKKEGQIRDHAPITEFLDPSHKRLMLLDNNFLASPRWRENLEFIEDSGLKVNFNQGLDIRRITEENAGMLADVDFSNQNWTGRYLIFAWDFPHIEKAVMDGIETLDRAGIHARSLMFYVLAGYNTTFAQDYYRFAVLDALGVDPFIMDYNKMGGPLVKKFARFVNKRLYRTRTFDEYDRLTPSEAVQVGMIINTVNAQIEEMGLA